MEHTYAIVTSTRSGNTAQVAAAVAEALAREDICYNGGVPEDGAQAVADADTVLAGFWTDKGTCADEMAAFLGQLSNKRVFLFGTAGFGGSAEYFEQIAARVAALLPADCELLGSAMCQGKMGAGVRVRYERMLAENPDDARAAAMLENFDRAATHPDAADLERIAAAARDAVR